MANPDPVQLPGGYVGPDGLNEFSIVSTVEDPPKLRLAAPWPSLGLGCVSLNRRRTDGGQEEMVLLQGKQDERYRNEEHNHTGEMTLHLRNGAIENADAGTGEVYCWRHDEVRLFGYTFTREQIGHLAALLGAGVPLPPAPGPTPGPAPEPPPGPVEPDYVALYGSYVVSEYNRAFGRDPEENELRSDSENVFKYGPGWLVESLSKRGGYV